MGERIFQYVDGAPVEVEVGIAFVELASAGDPKALQTLIYPGSPAELPPIVFFTNPDMVDGFDNDQLILPPSRTLTRTLDDKVLTSFENTLVDREVELFWTNDGGKLSMSTAMYRELRNYDENSPDPLTLGNIVWIPANASTKQYEVQFVYLKAGAEVEMPRVSPEFRPIGGGGTVDGVAIAGPDGDLGVEFQSSGWQTETIALRMRILAEVV